MKEIRYITMNGADYISNARIAEELGIPVGEVIAGQQERSGRTSIDQRSDEAKAPLPVTDRPRMIYIAE